ncbi:hypothetical protein Q3G72_008311 [Acer saccharum]|nr:hypothetical protein Q3G72_008311 [Acer saccharum]
MHGRYGSSDVWCQTLSYLGNCNSYRRKHSVVPGCIMKKGFNQKEIRHNVTKSSRNVDCCLIPESPFYLEAPGGIFEFIGKRLKKNGHMVIVITEGAGMRISKDKGTDASGNKLLHDGLWISQKSKGTLCRKAKDGYKSEVYRSKDRHTLSMQFLAIHLIMCTTLSWLTVPFIVNSDMVGYTGFTVSPVNGRHAAGSCNSYKRKQSVKPGYILKKGFNPKENQERLRTRFSWIYHWNLIAFSFENMVANSTFMTVVQSDSPKEGHIFRRSGPYMRVSTSDEVYGGYGDFYAHNTLPLTPKVVNNIHNRGGTILGISLGSRDTSKIVNSIQFSLFTFGGDGTLKGASAIFEIINII